MKYAPTIPHLQLTAIQHARHLYRLRRRRDALFGDWFGEPVWDILLDLLIAHHEQRSVAVSSLCIAAAVPATTALRWIAKMIDDGMLLRIDDDQDARRSFITLAEPTRERLVQFLNETLPVAL